ncbi:hypothetical protein OIE68_09380 [Nocardia vinacea]|uniref:Uncharacterized protein n=1 Tax=Nocardia vinacea TaxID=96468 RepID=A0ABZ1YV06_9NOCA|nr:hypothetical protein OIE68_09380 [Nocardia vinacea]
MPKFTFTGIGGSMTRFSGGVKSSSHDSNTCATISYRSFAWERLDMVSIGDHVLLVAGGVSVFTVIEIDGDHAIVESTQVDSPGRYLFRVPVAELVAAVSDSGGGD